MPSLVIKRSELPAQVQDLLKNLQAYRLGLGFKQVDLAVRVGLSSSVISYVERGNDVSYYTVRKLCDYFGVAYSLLPAESKSESKRASRESKPESKPESKRASEPTLFDSIETEKKSSLPASPALSPNMKAAVKVIMEMCRSFNLSKDRLIDALIDTIN